MSRILDALRNLFNRKKLLTEGSGNVLGENEEPADETYESITKKIKMYQEELDSINHEIIKLDESFYTRNGKDMRKAKAKKLEIVRKLSEAEIKGREIQANDPKWTEIRDEQSQKTGEEVRRFIAEFNVEGVNSQQGDGMKNTSTNEGKTIKEVESDPRGEI